MTPRAAARRCWAWTVTHSSISLLPSGGCEGWHPFFQDRRRLWVGLQGPQRAHRRPSALGLLKKASERKTKYQGSRRQMQNQLNMGRARPHALTRFISPHLPSHPWIAGAWSVKDPNQTTCFSPLPWAGRGTSQTSHWAFPAPGAGKGRSPGRWGWGRHVHFRRSAWSSQQGNAAWGGQWSGLTPAHS